jgi:hypothetical protein
MHYRHLYYFVRIVEAGSFSQATRTIHVAQPALSQQIAELEASLGVPLLQRSARGVKPTAAGQKFYDEASSILRKYENLPGLVRSNSEPERQSHHEQDVQHPDIAHERASDGGVDARRIAPVLPDRLDDGGDRRADRTMPERRDPARQDFALPRGDARPQAMRSRAQIFRPGRVMGGGFRGGGGRHRL